MNWFLARLKERSTWLALFTFAGLFGMKMEPELREYIINAIIAVAAVAAFIFKEKPDPSLPHRLNTKASLQYEEKPNAPDHHQIPPIELQGQSESIPDALVDYPVDRGNAMDADSSSTRHAHQSGYRLPLQPNDKPESTGWNG